MYTYETRYFSTRIPRFRFIVPHEWLVIGCTASAMSPCSLIEHKRTEGQWSDMRLVRAIRHPLSLFDNRKNAIKNLNGNIGQRHSDPRHQASISHPSALSIMRVSIPVFYNPSQANFFGNTRHQSARSTAMFLRLVDFDRSNDYDIRRTPLFAIIAPIIHRSIFRIIKI